MDVVCGGDCDAIYEQGSEGISAIASLNSDTIG